MSDKLTKYEIAMVQMSFAFLNREANMNKAEAAIREAAAHGAKLVCLPEAFDTGYVGTQLPEMMAIAEPEDSAALRRMCAVAADCQVHVLAPMLCSMPSGEVENRAYLIDDAGELLGWYTKTHLVNAERGLLCRGSDYPVFDTKLGKIGISICYDLRFPEPSRIMALKGAQVLLVSAAWRDIPHNKEWWDTKIRCRAMDSLLWVAAVNMAGPTGDFRFSGGSQICDPFGDLQCRFGIEEEKILYGEIDLSRIEEVRACNATMEDRHPEDYGVICGM